MRVTFLVHDLSNNAVGRAWSLALVAEHLGWKWRVVAGASDAPWPPLADDAFLDHCTVVGPRLTPAAVRQSAASTDLFIAVKAIPGSFGVFERAGLDIPILVDIDDDDLTQWRDSITPRQRMGLIRPSHWLHGSSPRALDRLAERIGEVPRMVSNPILQSRHGGIVVPHARAVPLGPIDVRRDDLGPSRTPVVAFIGTPRPHKGLDKLRQALASMAPDERWTLLATAPPPGDARPDEHWVGTTTLASLGELLRGVDVLAAPSDNSDFAQAQAPVKLVDAMLRRTAVLAADLPVQRWMTGGHAVHGASTPDVIADALRSLRDVSSREALTTEAFGHARELFSIEAVAGPLQLAAHGANR